MKLLAWTISDHISDILNIICLEQTRQTCQDIACRCITDILQLCSCSFLMNSHQTTFNNHITMQKTEVVTQVNPISSAALLKTQKPHVL